MEWNLSEPYSPYDYLRQNAPYPPYNVWEALSPAEREAVLSFQDLGSKQDAWDVCAPDPVHVNCSIVNSYLRYDGFSKIMSPDDLQQCEELISLLDSAVAKSVLPKKLNVIRGLTNSEWVEGFEEGMIYREKGYGSYSLSVDAAVRYAQKNKYGKLVFFTRSIKAGEHALYLGSKEEEMLIERGCKYIIREIDEVEKGILSPSCRAIVYILESI